MYATPVLTADTATAIRRIEEQFWIVAGEQKPTRWKSTGWQNHVEGFAKFVNEPLASLLRNPSTRLAAHDFSLSMVMVLGASRILNEANSVDVESRFPRGMADTDFMRGVNSILNDSRVIHDRDDDSFSIPAEHAVLSREKVNFSFVLQNKC